jgi:nicotinamide mononucleotide (NMN) deamidase PncC
VVHATDLKAALAGVPGDLLAGRVYLGVVDGDRTDVTELDLTGDRATLRQGAVDAAVTALLARLAPP